MVIVIVVIVVVVIIVDDHWWRSRHVCSRHIRNVVWNTTVTPVPNKACIHRRLRSHLRSHWGSRRGPFALIILTTLVTAWLAVSTIHVRFHDKCNWYCIIDMAIVVTVAVTPWYCYIDTIVLSMTATTHHRSNTAYPIDELDSAGRADKATTDNNNEETYPSNPSTFSFFIQGELENATSSIHVYIIVCAMDGMDEMDEMDEMALGGLDDLRQKCEGGKVNLGRDKRDKRHQRGGMCRMRQKSVQMYLVGTE